MTGAVAFDKTVDQPVVAGVGRLAVARVGARSVVARAFATSPLKLLTPRNHGAGAWIYTSTYGGGLVGGDAIAIEIDVAAGALAFLGSQASTKVYRSAQLSQASLSARVEAGATLIVLPDPVVCFADSRYEQRQQIDLAADSGLVLVDWMTSGRSGSGERWMFDRYRSSLEIRRNERLVVKDAVTLASADGPLLTRGGRFNVLALAVVMGTAFAGHVVSRLSADATKRQPRPLADRLVSLAPIGVDGFVLRVAGHSVEAVGATLRDYLSFLPAALGDDPWIRKW